MMKIRMLKIWVYIFLLLPSVVFADLQITVEPHKGWGPAPTSNIKTLCENVALHFQEHLRDAYKIDGKITIVYHEDHPIIFYRSYWGGAADEYKIGIFQSDTYWDGYSYQFAHEFCHILHNFEETPPPDANHWLQEAICELANVWALRRMSETWADRPPYPNWVSYRHQLKRYADEHKNRQQAQYLGTGAQWLSEFETEQRSVDEFDYAKLAQLSYKFLPIFEENPEAWNAIRQMPTSDSRMSMYMKEWYNTVDPEDKRFVKAMADVMGITVTGSVIAVSTDTIDADIDNDGYVDLSDVMIVRSAIQNTTTYDTDVNNDGTTNEIDLLLVKAKAFEAIAAAAPSLIRKRKMKVGTWGDLKKR